MLQVPANCFASTRRGRVIVFSIALFVFAALSSLACAQTYKVIHNFTNFHGDGANPYSGLLPDADGNYFGSTNLGGAYGAGSVYQLSPNGSGWTYTNLYSFKGLTDPSGPAFGTLAFGTLGSQACYVYGTTEGGGYFGTTWKVRTQAKGCPVMHAPWTETVLHRFGHGKDGIQPIGGVVFDAEGNLYGTTSQGGTFGGGTVYEITAAGVTSILYNFTGADDAFNPVAGLTMDASGNLYGTTSLGGAFGNGIVYKLSKSDSGWTQTVLYAFQAGSDGSNPVGGVVLDAAGHIYGGTLLGGDNLGGTIYELSPSGDGYVETTLYKFSTYYGPYNSLTLDAHGSLYGAANMDGANGMGMVFKLTPGAGGWTFTDLHDFAGGADGTLPYGAVTVDAAGNVFGTAAAGGSLNQGLIYEITP